MPSKAQLEVRGRKLAKDIHDINEREDLTPAQRSEALDKLRPEFTETKAALASCEEATKMVEEMGGLGAGTALAPQVESADVAGLRMPSLKQMKGQLAKQVLSNPEYRKITDFKGGSRFDTGFEVSLKSTSEANNVMGELLYGTSGPTAIGSAPFGTGAFGPGIMPTWLPGIVETLLYPLSISDLISSRPVQGPNISYLTESTLAMQANAVAEGAAYPFSSAAFSRVYEEVGKIANAMDLTDEALRDGPELFNFVQNRLLEGIQRQEEAQILAGSGYPEVNGLLNRASSFTASSSSSLFGSTSATGSNVSFPPSGTTGAGLTAQVISSLAYGRKVTGVTGSGLYPTASVVAENIMDAFVDIWMAVFQQPNAIICNPRDWELIRLAKDANDQYYGGSFFGGDYGYGKSTGKQLWDTPVVATPLVPQHTILTGWFDASTIQVARREGISMQMTNSNGTNFIDGIVTVRAEERLGLLVYRPTAFQLIQLATG